VSWLDCDVEACSDLHSHEWSLLVRVPANWEQPKIDLLASAMGDSSLCSDVARESEEWNWRRVGQSVREAAPGI
jgi:hypothetical protein